MRLEEDIKIWLAQASELLAPKEFAQAEQLIEKVLGIQADHFDALVLFGILYVSTNRGSLYQTVNQMIKQYPDKPWALSSIIDDYPDNGSHRNESDIFTSLMETTASEANLCILMFGETKLCLGR